MTVRFSRGWKTDVPDTDAQKKSARYVRGDKSATKRKPSGMIANGMKMPLMKTRGNFTIVVIIMIVEGWSTGGADMS
jgi:hypothetical protein